MTTIVRRPQGLLSLLELRDMGAVPRDIDPRVQAGVDLTQFFLVDREDVSGSTSVLAVGGGIPLITVPAGELWYIHALGARSDALTAGQRIAIGMVQQAVNGGFAVPISEVARATQTGERCFIYSPAGFWLNPGGTLGINCTDLAAGPVTVASTAVVSKFRV